MALLAAFREFTPETIDRIISGQDDESAEAKKRGHALKLWTQEQYGHIFGPMPFNVKAAQEFMAAMQAEAVPEWIVNIAPLSEIRAVAKGGGA